MKTATQLLSVRSATKALCQQIFIIILLFVVQMVDLFVDGRGDNDIKRLSQTLNLRQSLVSSVKEGRGRSRREVNTDLPTFSSTQNFTDTSFINSTVYLTTANETTVNISSVTQSPSSRGNGQGAGTIIGAFFGVLLGCAIVGGALYLLVRYKRAQSAEYSRTVQVHMSSTRNAGVYVDLAEPADPRFQKYTPRNQNDKGSKTDRLMQPDLYEYDSDDEVCVYK